MVRDLLHRAARERKESCLRSASIGTTLVEDRVENVAAHTTYDADLHGRNQLKHGSWVLQLVVKPVAVPKT